MTTTSITEASLYMYKPKLLYRIENNVIAGSVDVGVAVERRIVSGEGFPCSVEIVAHHVNLVEVSKIQFQMKILFVFWNRMWFSHSYRFMDGTS